MAMVGDWRALVTELQPQVRLFTGAIEAEIKEAEQAIGGSFPVDLRTLLRQTNGVLDEWEYGPIRPLAGLVEATLFWRSVDLAEEYDQPAISLSSFVVIGTDAGGGPFGFFIDSPHSGVIHAFDGEEGVFHKGGYALEEYLRHYFQELSSFSE